MDAPTEYQPPLKASDIKLHELTYLLDKELSILRDDEDSLYIKAPAFRASATFEIPILPAGVKIQIGWIQVCTDATTICGYGDSGIVSWEIPELITGKYQMISDGNRNNYPWYGSAAGITGVEGPTQGKIVASAQMRDGLKIECLWVLPIKQVIPHPTLTFVYRKQKFYAYLVLKDVIKNSYQILKTIEWSIEMAFDVDVNKPVGKRSTFLGSFDYGCPKIVPEHLTPPLQCYALCAPNCNTAQVVIWRPYGDGEIELLARPKCSTMNVLNYVLHSDVISKNLMNITKENFLSGKI